MHVTGAGTTADLLRQAAEAFREIPMPLDACLSLRALLSQHPCDSDPLFTFMDGRDVPLQNQELATLLQGIPLGGWRLSGATINVLVDEIARHRPAAVLEFGSGVSTLVLAAAMRAVHGQVSRPLVFSIDQAPEFLADTERLLKTHGLRDLVRLHCAPLIQHNIQGFSTVCYGISEAMLASFFEGQRPDFILIDGPAADYGQRFGTLSLVEPHVSPDARVYMDDALRDSELAIADYWNRLGQLTIEGIRWVGKGLLVGRRSPCASSSQQAGRLFLSALLLEGAEGHSKRGVVLAAPVQAAPDAPVARTCDAPGVAIPASAVPSPPSVEMIAETIRIGDPQPATAPTCLFLNTYYQGFLDDHYKRHAGLAAASYDEQHRSLQQVCFGDSDFYSSGLRQAGWQAYDLIANCAPLQRQWAQEHHLPPQASLLTILVAQILAVRPQVLYLQDLSLATPEFVSAVRPHVALIVGQIASSLPSRIDLKVFDILVSSFPHFVDHFRAQGITAYYQPLAFDPRVRAHLGVPAQGPRTYPLTFVGGLSPAHRERQELLTTIGADHPLHYWGYGTSALAQHGIDASRLHGDVWGLDMFAVLARSGMTLNHHSEAAKANANNMRLFEATGCGALLVTDYKDNLSDLFEPESEVVAYRSLSECQDLIRYYLAHPEEAAAIAARGQARTLRDHTYAARMRQTGEFLQRQLDIRNGVHRLPPPDLGKISYGHEPLGATDVSATLARAWQSDDIPAKQRALVDRELAEMYRGRCPAVFRILADALAPHIRPGVELLEVGCASGYYSEALEYLLRSRVTYRGVDYSEAMIRMARAYYPGIRFDVGDGAALPLRDASVPLVVTSAVIMHVEGYAEHIREASRVASEVVVLHRTPMSRTSPTSRWKKKAYGVETMEFRFNEADLLRLCTIAGLELLSRRVYEPQSVQDAFDATYVLRKVAHAA